MSKLFLGVTILILAAIGAFATKKALIIGDIYYFDQNFDTYKFYYSGAIWCSPIGSGCLGLINGQPQQLFYYNEVGNYIEMQNDN